MQNIPSPRSVPQCLCLTCAGQKLQVLPRFWQENKGDKHKEFGDGPSWSGLNYAFCPWLSMIILDVHDWLCILSCSLHIFFTISELFIHQAAMSALDWSAAKEDWERLLAEQGRWSSLKAVRSVGSQRTGYSRWNMASYYNWVVVSPFFEFHNGFTYIWGRWSILTNGFQRGWNHQLVTIWSLLSFVQLIACWLAGLIANGAGVCSSMSQEVLRAWRRRFFWSDLVRKFVEWEGWLLWDFKIIFMLKPKKLRVQVYL